MSLRFWTDNGYTVNVDKGKRSRIRVLIVDNHEAVRRALRIRLSVPRHLEVVGTLADIDLALAQIPILKPDVIILGLQNSTIEDRSKTATSVRMIANDSTVVIVLAPYIDAVEREIMLQAGAKRYLLKHINSEELIHEIDLSAPSMPAYH